MATEYYSLPTINGADTIDGVNAINGLANATDAALRSVANSIPSLDNVNAQLATLSQQVGTANTTANAASTAAANAQSTATLANSTAQNANTAVSNLQNKQTPILTAFTPSPGGSYGQTVNGIFANYVRSELAQLCTAKVAIQGLSFSLESGNTNADNPIYVLGTVPAPYIPSASFATVIGVYTQENIGAEKVVVLYLNVSGTEATYPGRVSISHQYYGTPSGAGSISGIYTDGIIPWFYGTETAE